MGKRWSVKATAQRLLDEAKAGADALKGQGSEPHLAVILAGDHPASQVYVNHKVKACERLGIRSTLKRLSADIDQAGLLAAIDGLNRDSSVHGILVQLPLPAHIPSAAVLAAVDPDKDVDGFHAINAGRLALGEDGLFPCTPAGIMELLADLDTRIEGKHAAVIGRSNIVGKPMAQLLLRANCTVSILHSRTRDPQAICRTADLVVAAVGRTAMVDEHWLKEDALVVDVGMNTITDRDELARLVAPDSKKMASFQERGSVLYGDVHYRSALKRAALVTPVPGGVGKLTIAQLMCNTIKAARGSLPR